MDPYDQQRLRDEVIYLHSLWHQGPPPRSPRANSSNGFLHQLSNRTQFKRQIAKPGIQRGIMNTRNQGEEILTESIQDSDKEWPFNPTSNNVAPYWPTVTSQSNSQPSWYSLQSGKEWPCNPSSGTPTRTSVWPPFTTQQNSQLILLSPEQQAKFAANQAQFKALKAAKVFFRSNNIDDDHDDIGYDDDDDDEDLGDNDHDNNEGEEDKDRDDLIEEECRVEEYRFFVKIFEEDSELRKYYEKNYQNGEFSCLVCCGVEKKKASKRFKDCVALIQHSVSIAKTKKRRAHRAYGKAICKVLGWDIHKLPAIVSTFSANLGVSLSNSGASDSKAQGHVGNENKDNPIILVDSEVQVDTVNSGELQGRESTCNETLSSNDESIISENSLTAVDTSICDTDPNLAAPNIPVDEGLGQPSDVILQDAVVGDEGKDVLCHDPVKNNSAS